MAGVKKGALRALRLVTLEQNAFNAAVVGALEELEALQESLRPELQAHSVHTAAMVASLEAELDRLNRRITAEVTRIDAEVARLDVTAASLAEATASHRELADLVHEVRDNSRLFDGQVESSRSDLSDVRAIVADLGRQMSRQQENMRLQDDRLTVLLREARRRLPEELEENQLRTFSDQLSRRFDALYTEFENRYRGSREDILARLAQYSDLIDTDTIVELGPVVDLGSGRGEWLEVLRTWDVPAYGIDVNADIGAAAERRGLDVRVEDGLEHLGKLPADSLGAVSMLHVAEHLDFETLYDVMRAALRVLAPGGTLLVETPNPSNLTVGASSFYLDPSHIAPVHPQLIEFLAMSAGFADTSIHYLNRPTEPEFILPEDLRNQSELQRLIKHINWALLGPLDYALIARKGLDPSP